jgi:ribosomal protein S18 acetylase RimI-like enzyme
MIIRPATHTDAVPIADIIMPVIRGGETYALDPDMSSEEAVAYWFGSDKHTFVATEGTTVLGTYYLRPNAGGGGRHVCNCGYVTSQSATGRGVARRMCEHSLSEARSQGYKAMQFNFVVATNDRAIDLWRSLGFRIIGRVPEAFLHPRAGLVDALVMHRAI